MKILAISAFHPPCHSGGYELRIKEIMDGLSQRGHQVRMLTNRANGPKKAETSAYPVLRLLHNRLKARFFLHELLNDLRDTRLLQREIEHFQPDVIYLGHTYILSKALLPFLARQQTPIYYDEGGSGLIEAWMEHGRWFRFSGDWRSSFAPLNWMKPLVVKLVCALGEGRIFPKWTWPEKMRIVFNSQLNQNNAAAAGVPVENSMVLHSGVDTDLFSFQPREGFGDPLRIICPGRLERRKGQLDAVELLHALLETGIDAHLTLAGAGWTDGYASEIENRIQQLGLQEKVQLKSMLTSTELVKEYHQADVCFFPSVFRTGFSRTPLEAMACGCIVISYGNEGSDEILSEEFPETLFSGGDYVSMIHFICDLAGHPAKVQEYTMRSRYFVERRYKINDYINSIQLELSTLLIKTKSNG